MLKIVTESASILQIIKQDNPLLIGIDGIDGVGKTSLAKEIETLGYFRISLDDFIKKKSGGYFEFVNYKKLINKLISKKGQLIVIEGVVLLKILKKIGVSLNYFVYVTDNVWLDDWDEEWQGKYTTMLLDEIICDVEQQTTKISRALNSNAKPYKMDGFRKEMYEYAFDYKSWNKAQVILRGV